MKSHFLLILLSTSIVFITSCSNTEKILPKKDGTWNIDELTILVEATGFPSSTDTELNYGEIFFDENGSGTITYSTGDIETFDWAVDEDEITIDFSVTGSVVFDIEVNEKDKQEWTSKLTEDIGGGIIAVSTTDLKLSRID